MVMTEKQKQNIERLKKSIESTEKTIEMLENHTMKMCEAGKHVTTGFATGGNRGEYLTYCMVCDYNQTGYD